MVELLEAVRNVFIQIDDWLLVTGNLSAQNSLFDSVFPLFDKSEYWFAPIILVMIGVIVFGRKRGVSIIIVATVIVLLTDQLSAMILKPMVARIRPCNVVSGLHVWWEHHWIFLPDPVIEIYKASWAFPSSHAANAAGQAVWWGLSYPRHRWWFAGYALLIGYTRIYLGHHWPMDVIAGWLLGGAIAYIVYVTALKYLPHYFRSTIGFEVEKESRDRTK